MKRSFFFGLGWMLIITAVLGLLASASPDNKTPMSITILALALRAVAAVVVLFIASNAAPATRRWPAIGMWFVGFILGFPLGNLLINGVVLALSAALS
jgi:hypothetical protein